MPASKNILKMTSKLKEEYNLKWQKQVQEPSVKPSTDHKETFSKYNIVF